MEVYFSSFATRLVRAVRLVRAITTAATACFAARFRNINLRSLPSDVSG